MIIVFHGLSFLILQLLKCGRYIRFFRKIKKNGIRLEEATSACTDLEENFKFNPPLYLQRYRIVYETLVDSKWRTQIKKVVDFGCADMYFFVFLKRLQSLHDILFVDIDEDILSDNLYRIRPFTIDYLNRRAQPLNITVLAGSVADPDCRVQTVDAVITIELIEHLYPDVLEGFPYNVFNYMHPKLVIITTPNSDFNVVFSSNGKRFRHYDHKFEWSREQFEDWATNITVRFPDYNVSFYGIGNGPWGRENLGQCTQMAIFVRKDVVDDEYILTRFHSPCLCSGSSPCRGLYVKCRLFCNCLCPLCTPSSSYGICTYLSCSKQIASCEIRNNLERNCLYGKRLNPSLSICYKLIEMVKYPFEYRDPHTEEERLLDQFKYKINLYGQTSKIYYVEEKNRAEVPLRDLLNGRYTDYISEAELHDLLVKNGYQIEECVIQESGVTRKCVIHVPLMKQPSTSERTSEGSSEASGYDSDYTKYHLNEESLSDWDEPWVQEENNKSSDSSKSSKGYSPDDVFPNWLLQILGTESVIEEAPLPGSEEDSHFYCQGDGLGVHPSVIAVEIDEEEDETEETTESSNNTANYTDAEQGPSSQDMSSLPADSQANIQESQGVLETEDNLRLPTSDHDYTTYVPEHDLDTNPD